MDVSDHKGKPEPFSIDFLVTLTKKSNTNNTEICLTSREIKNQAFTMTFY